MIDTTLIDHLTVLAKKEKKIKEYKRRVRIRGRVVKKAMTKNGNITFYIQNVEPHFFKFIILRSHRERFVLAEKLKAGQSISIEGIPKVNTIICSRLKYLEKGVEKGIQKTLDDINHNS